MSQRRHREAERRWRYVEREAVKATKNESKKTQRGGEEMEIRREGGCQSHKE